MKLNRKAIMKGRGRIWLLCCCQDLGFVFFLFWQNSFGVCFFLFNSNSLYKCYFKLPCVYIIVSFQRKLFLNFVIWEIVRTEPLFVGHTYSHIHALTWIFLFLLPDWELNKYRIMQEYFARDSIKKSIYVLWCISVIIWKFILLSSHW